MKTYFNIYKATLLVLIFFSLTPTAAQVTTSGKGYTLVVKGYDWGPAVNKVILPNQRSITETNASHFSVTVNRSAEGVAMEPEISTGERKVVYAYVSDSKGNRVTEGHHITLVLFVGPDDVLGSPIKYIRTKNRGSNQWIDYRLIINHKPSGKIWDNEQGRIMPEIDTFDLSGTYSHNDITLSYASFTPQNDSDKWPLIIWLHGGGEGGTDPSIPLIANKAVNYASEEIQALFGGAFVLAPQSPTFWMQSASGEYTRGKEDDIYNEALMAFIKTYVAAHPEIDTDRIYIGGCSNGGYMGLKLLLQHPDYFAAGYISALAYQNQFITDEQVRSIKDIPIWFVHSKDDQVTIPGETVVPLYKRLKNTGAENIHFSFYDHVIDITGFFGGDDYRYNGHWSWIYSHANHADFDFDGNPVLMNGRPVTIMEWMAGQRR
ncbi:prolyl oligopeptidase family serine peptidase [Flavobacteriaceae bacterium TP-CH-4]|uniref:Prolyl oligopeptidase family serine peptidase n=1 Tax=Pelagihabitans pacificus TaxID=2696054 RepID=A0A967ATE4_9FLAO|nr:prolyl oligopeptidase family serine peptidase [Pelagihabitans pacificus]NHF59587.1 prolyl oligopeptidase family serine peptidase [Pelagihabitans pacificus]